MALFKKKRTDFVDLGERMRKQQERANEIKEDMGPNSVQSATTETESAGSSTGGGIFSFFGKESTTTTTSAESEPADYSSAEQKRKKLAKRLGDITTRLEELSNSIYKIEQRLEVIERKSGLGY